MIFELLQDFAAVLDATPAEHPRHRILSFLDEAIRRDVHFIERHPTTLFQCLWNTCWWYDSPEAAGHYEEKQSPGENKGGRLYNLLAAWRTTKEQETPEGLCGFARCVRLRCIWARRRNCCSEAMNTR